jgi:hypothetical protein
LFGQDVALGALEVFASRRGVDADGRSHVLDGRRPWNVEVPQVVGGFEDLALSVGELGQSFSATLAEPSGTPTASSALTPRLDQTFCRITSDAPRDRAYRYGRLPISSPMSATSAVSMGASVPAAPIASRDRPPLMRTPFFAALVMAETTDTGVEMTKAQGQAITSRVRPLTNQGCHAPGTTT